MNKKEVLLKDGKIVEEIGSKRRKEIHSLIKSRAKSNMVGGFNPIVYNPNKEERDYSNPEENMLNTVYRSNLGELHGYNQLKHVDIAAIRKKLLALARLKRELDDLDFAIRDDMSWLGMEGECLEHVNKPFEVMIETRWKRKTRPSGNYELTVIMVWTESLDAKRGGAYKDKCLITDIVHIYKDLLFFDLGDRLLVLSERNQADVASKRKRKGYEGYKKGV